ncbi:DUF2752 domain-containing protein [Flavobacteriaceae bacterium LMO-SS05]
MVISKSRLILIVLGAILFLGIVSLYFFWNPEGNNFFPKCPLHSLTGLYCPGCGSQRAMHQIIHGNIIEGLKYNYLIALLAIVLLYQSIIYVMNQLFDKTYYNILHHPLTIKLILVFIILFWVLRNIRVYPFTVLAP